MNASLLSSAKGLRYSEEHSLCALSFSPQPVHLGGQGSQSWVALCLPSDLRHYRVLWNSVCLPL